MKTFFHYTALILFLFSACLTACSDSDEVQDSIIFEKESTEIVFSSGGPGSQTLKFNATADWILQNHESEWVEITPASGAAGDASLTIRLLESTADAERSLKVTITAGKAAEDFTVIQKITERLQITGSQKYLKLGFRMSLGFNYHVEGGGQPTTVVWTSSNPNVASVTQNGEVEALLSGETTTITLTADTFTDEFELEVVEEHITDNNFVEYSFATLASLSYGITVEDGWYIVNQSIHIADNDILVLPDNQNVKIRDGVEIRINGMADFKPENGATISRYDDSSRPRYIYFTGDHKAGGEISNITLVDCPIRYFGVADLIIDNCVFRDISSNAAAVSCNGSGLVSVTNCRFLNNNYPAVDAGANTGCAVVFNDNYLYRNNSSGGNRPQINLVAGGGDIELSGNEIIGFADASNRGGGIAVSNSLGMMGPNYVVINGNTVTECRYGITTTGLLEGRITNNILLNNNYETNPMNGGSGIAITNTGGGQKLYISGNHIEGHLWGISNYGNQSSAVGANVNLGNLTEGIDYNPGLNVFKNNGNNGKLYDLYNNSALDMYAQGNTWNVAVQDEASIEEVIYHKNDEARLGRVIFMPAAQ